MITLTHPAPGGGNLAQAQARLYFHDDERLPAAIGAGSYELVDPCWMVQLDGRDLRVLGSNDEWQDIARITGAGRWMVLSTRRVWRYCTTIPAVPVEHSTAAAGTQEKP